MIFTRLLICFTFVIHIFCEITSGPFEFRLVYDYLTYLCENGGKIETGGIVTQDTLDKINSNDIEKRDYILTMMKAVCNYDKDIAPDKNKKWKNTNASFHPENYVGNDIDETVNNLLNDPNSGFKNGLASNKIYPETRAKIKGGYAGVLERISIDAISVASNDATTLTELSLSLGQIRKHRYNVMKSIYTKNEDKYKPYVSFNDDDFTISFLTDETNFDKINQNIFSKNSKAKKLDNTHANILKRCEQQQKLIELKITNLC